jgi:putative membrane protein
VRALADLYGARPGKLGFMRLSRAVSAHLVITGGMAMGETLVQQLIGHGLAARLSAKLGEGVVNGLMTARVGLSTIDLVRPLPFCALDRPKLTDVMAEITRTGV